MTNTSHPVLRWRENNTNDGLVSDLYDPDSYEVYDRAELSYTELDATNTKTTAPIGENSTTLKDIDNEDSATVVLRAMTVDAILVAVIEDGEKKCSFNLWFDDLGLEAKVV